MLAAGTFNTTCHDPVIWRTNLQSNASKLFVPQGGAMELVMVPRDKHGMAERNGHQN